jgi:hypothetical protein
MIVYCKENLQEIKQLIAILTDIQYTHASPMLANASIGQHVRHILEFYICLRNGASVGVINYDNRERDLRIEENRDFALFSIDKICSNINLLTSVAEVKLEGNFSSEDGAVSVIRTFINRELAYCLEHSIHHQALIKVGLLEQNLAHLIPSYFGLAPSTLRYRDGLLK